MFKSNKMLFLNFSWLIKDEIAGMAKPVSLVSDFKFLKSSDIGAIVSLTERPLQPSVIEEFGFEYTHIPVVDFTVPTSDQIDAFVRFSKDLRLKEKKIAVHCDAGMGRTGTMLAVYLVSSKGYTAKDAISEVRKKRPGSIETSEQEDVIYKYEERTSNREI
ncbi:MAG: dual specificity protein phosphatase 23 [Candidatus Anammoxibacter sp.]